MTAPPRVLPSAHCVACGGVFARGECVIEVRQVLAVTGLVRLTGTDRLAHAACPV